MELIKKQWDMMQKEAPISDQFYVEEDVNVPDVKPDIRSIVASDGETRVEEVRKVEKYLKINGTYLFRVLYVTEEGECHLSVMEGKVPFEEMVYVGEQTGEFRIQQADSDLTVSLIHSRKIAFKALITITVAASGVYTGEIICDVMEEGLQKKIEEVQALTVHTQKHDIHRIKEEIELSGTKETIGNILWSDVQKRKLETRLEQDQLVLWGELEVFVLYESLEEKQDYLLETLPFEGVVSGMGINPSMFHQIHTSLDEVNLEARIDEDGEMRVIGVEAALEVDLTVYQEQEIGVLEDVYALDEICETKTCQQTFETLLMKNQSRCKIKEKISLPEIKSDMLQICHSSGKLQVDEVEVAEDGLNIEGILHVQFLYIKSDDLIPYETWVGMVPFSFFLECKGIEEGENYYLENTLEQLSVGLLGNGDVEVKAVLAFDGFFKKKSSLPMITEILLKDMPEEAQKQAPDIIGYQVHEGDKLWDLAKRYQTTKESILEMNHLESEMLIPQQKILIFREKMGIL